MNFKTHLGLCYLKADFGPQSAFRWTMEICICAAFIQFRFDLETYMLLVFVSNPYEGKAVLLA